MREKKEDFDSCRIQLLGALTHASVVAWPHTTHPVASCTWRRLATKTRPERDTLGTGDMRGRRPQHRQNNSGCSSRKREAATYAWESLSFRHTTETQKYARTVISANNTVPTIRAPMVESRGCSADEARGDGVHAGEGQQGQVRLVGKCRPSAKGAPRLTLPPVQTSLHVQLNGHNFTVPRTNARN